MDDWYDWTDFLFCFAAWCFRTKNHIITTAAMSPTTPPITIPAIAPPLMGLGAAATVGKELAVDTPPTDALLCVGIVFRSAEVVLALLPPKGVGPPPEVEFRTVLVYPVIMAHPKPIEPDEYTYCAQKGICP